MRAVRVLVVAVLVFALAACNPDAAPEPAAVGLQRAVRRTLTERTARVAGVVTNERGGVAVEGVVSLVDRRAQVEARSLVADGAIAEVRVTKEGAWVRTPASGGWIAVDPSTVHDATGGWQAFFLQVDKATGIGHRRGGYRAVVSGRPTTIDLDGRGRISRLRLTQAGSALDFHFTEFGIPVEVSAP